MTTPSRTRSSTTGPMWRMSGGEVRVLDGPDRGRSLQLEKQPMVIGTADDCQLVLHDSKVSRRHCEISVGAYGFRVRDLGSRNGTYFESSRVNDIAAPPGAIVLIGATHLVLSARAEDDQLPPSPRSSFGSLIGASLAMRRTFTLLERAAASDVTVLLGGETGTGKELAARSLHDEGSRARARFEVFDCGAVAPGLIASELFGHQKGAFSGADRDRPGVFARAHKGTVFLDEIAELPLALQPALLRVCDQAEVTPVGAAAPVTADVRLIAATRRDLGEEVVAGRFREDLYYRFHVLPITLPPLRARRDDLPLLCDRLLRELGAIDPGPIEGEPLARLATYRWPGNVRELRNVLERALVRGGSRARFAQLTFDLDEAASTGAGHDGSFTAQKKEVVARFEREFLIELMGAHDNNVKQAARASGIERMQLKRLLRRHGLL